MFLYLYWSFFDFVSIRELFGMAGGPRSRPSGVDSGPGEGGSEGVRGAPAPYKTKQIYSHPDVHHVKGFVEAVRRQGRPVARGRSERSRRDLLKLMGPKTFQNIKTPTTTPNPPKTTRPVVLGDVWGGG